MQFVLRLPALWQVLGGMLLFLLPNVRALAAEPAGRVLFTVGAPTAIAPDGTRRELRKGDGVEEGELLVTGDGRLQLLFKDNGVLALYPGTRFQIQKYRYAAAGDEDNGVVLRLLQGGLRTISGLVGKRRSDYRMETGVATIGIRGTEYGLQLGETLIGNVGEGAIEVCNAAGCLPVGINQAFLVPSMTEMPVLAQLRVQLPAPAMHERQSLAKQGDEEETLAGPDVKVLGRASDRGIRSNGKSRERLDLGDASQPVAADASDERKSRSTTRWRKYFRDDEFARRLDQTRAPRNINAVLMQAPNASLAGPSQPGVSTPVASPGSPASAALQSAPYTLSIPAPGAALTAGAASIPPATQTAPSRPAAAQPIQAPPGWAEEFVPPGQLRTR